MLAVSKAVRAAGLDDHVGYNPDAMPDDIEQSIHFELDGPTLFGMVDTNSLMGDEAQGIGDAIVDEMQASGEGLRTVALDISQVSTINSMTLGMLVTVQTTLLQHGVEFCLIGVAQLIRELLDATRLSSVFMVFDTRQAFLNRVDA